jgi:B12 binding domain
MPYLAARVPPGWEVSHMDEEAEEIDWNLEVEVVGLTFHTPSALHAYDIASRFRSRGICVVMGGPHVTLLPEEAGHYADVIFIGEAEGLWEEFLTSFEAVPIEVSINPPACRRLKMPPWHARIYFTGTTTRMAFCLRPEAVRANVISAPSP